MLVEQLGSDLKELKSLEDAGSVHEARSTLNRLLAAQEQERKELEEHKTAPSLHPEVCIWTELRATFREPRPS